MAPNGETLITASHTRSSFDKPPKPRRISMEGLQRAISDLSFELRKEGGMDTKLPAISEVQDAKCECCGMSEECTPEYVHRVREKFSGKWICGLCSEAVKEEVGKNGGRLDEALDTHMSVCGRFNRIVRTHPVLLQAEAMRDILRKSRLDGRGARAKSNSPRERVSVKRGGITRSSSCISAITN
ncbi:hypothetical protein COCNU_contig69158245G000010 [Cocos nucifera]|nr:hypothetical protein [Cocos nucifera]